MTNEPASRSALRHARRVVVKAGTSVVANADGQPSLTRMGAITEQISELMRSGTQVIFVSSGAVGMGRKLLKKQRRMHMSFEEIQTMEEKPKRSDSLSEKEIKMAIEASSIVGLGTRANNEDSRSNGLGSSSITNSSFGCLLEASRASHSKADVKKQYDSACAAAGQFEMMNFYSALFSQRDIAASQILVTHDDFDNEARLENLVYAIERLLSLGVLPIINENDAVSGNKGYDETDEEGELDILSFSDNDSLAALCARSFNAEVLLLLTDVDGIYTGPPKEKSSKMLTFYNQETNIISIGTKSLQGRGGMKAKIEAAESAVKPGSSCTACLVASGHDLDAIVSILGPSYDPSFGPPKGTLIATPGTELHDQCIKELCQVKRATVSVTDHARSMATAARDEARKLQEMSYDDRRAVLYAIADSLYERRDQILEANKADMEAAMKNDTDEPLIRRLRLTEEKLQTLSAGIRQIADNPDPLGVVRGKREIAKDLVLTQITVPIGVIMIIFESRPDSLPQIAALSIASGNGLLLKGGKEASFSNVALHEVIGDAVESASKGKVGRAIIGLVSDRGQVADMLGLDDVIDLVIPRGGNALVSHIKANTKIPVLGHADGVCHIYASPTADAVSLGNVVVDAKTDYPSACNAMETLLVHQDTVTNGIAIHALTSLRAAGVKCLGGPKAMQSGLCDTAAKEMKYEYGDYTCMVEVVKNMDDAIDWIHKYGSGHTEAIVCSDDDPEGEEFLRRVDAACVFKNASTRFADGFRFGLGAEVGISTGRIHARGPVGVEGLLTTKWQIRSKGINFVAEYAGVDPQKRKLSEVKHYCIANLLEKGLRTANTIIEKWYL